MEILISEKQINKAIKTIATQINNNPQKDVVFICLLNGGFLFYSELVKLINFDIQCDFLRVKSYIKKNTQGDIQILKDIETPIKNKTIYIVDDIFDSGNTMKAVIDYLQVKEPKQINIITLLKRKNSPTVDHNFYYGFEIENEWVVGMGMDDENGFKRNHKIIYNI
jgi:hypoxanthine phosphoribosyltransferase